MVVTLYPICTFSRTATLRTAVKKSYSYTLIIITVLKLFRGHSIFQPFHKCTTSTLGGRSKIVCTVKSVDLVIM